MSDYWQGLLTIPVLLISVSLVWLAYTLAHYAWRKLHEAMFWTGEVRSKLAPSPYDSDPGERTRMMQVEAVDRFADTLKNSGGKYRVYSGLGLVVMVAREVPNGGCNGNLTEH